MHIALHPHTHHKITLTDHIREFGNDALELQERARCPWCLNRMSNRASSTPNSTGHFAHLPKSGYCPTKEISGLPYLGKHPRHPDPESAIKIKKRFVDGWQKHFAKLAELAPGLHTDEFKKVIGIATQERIWEYANLEEYQIPYIFATLMDYPATASFIQNKKHVRHCWFRFWFDSSVQQYDDLWINRTGPLMLSRAWYGQPKRGKPKLEDLIDFYPVEVKPDFISQDRKVSPYVVGKIEKWIIKYFQCD